MKSGYKASKYLWNLETIKEFCTIYLMGAVSKKSIKKALR
jgi:hypothetical protein